MKAAHRAQNKHVTRITILILAGIAITLFGVFGGTYLNALVFHQTDQTQSGSTSAKSQESITPNQITDSHWQTQESLSSSASSQEAEESKQITSDEGLNTSTIIVPIKTSEGGTGSSATPSQEVSIPAAESSLPKSDLPESSEPPTTSEPGTSEPAESKPESSGTVIPGNRPKPDDNGNDSVSIQEIKLDQTELTINKSNTVQLTASIFPQNITESKTITWTSSDPEIASVDTTGTVTANRAGTVTITAKAGSHTAVCNITVVILMDGIILNHDQLTINKNSTAQLTASILPEDTTDDKTVTWTSEDSSTATVDDSGKVTALKTGTAKITATANGLSAACDITVTSPMVGIELDKTTLTINRNTTDELTVSFLPGDTTDDRTVIWESSDTAIADVDQQGNVVAHRIGTSTVTATCGEFTASCEVTVIALIDGIYLDQSAMTIDRGENRQLTASILPEDTTEDKTVVWTSSDPAVATVDSSGRVTAVGIGNATITAQVGRHTAASNVTVVALIHSIALDQTELTLDRGTSDQLVISFDPPDTTEDKTVIWTSSDPAVAAVDSSGQVTAVSPGNTIVTATVGTHSASCSVRVRDTFVISTAASGNGTVSAGGTVIEDDAITLTATPAIGHHLVSWTNSKGEMRTETEFTYYPDESTTWTALFEIDTYDSDQVSIPDTGDGGQASISPEAPYTYGQQVTYSAAPEKGYHFVRWTSNYGDVQSAQSFTWTLTGPITWTPHFEGNDYLVTVVAASPEIDAGGTATSGGAFKYGSSRTLTATPASRFRFINWTSSLGDVVTTRTFSYTLDEKIADAGSITWTANFELDAFVTASYEDGDRFFEMETTINGAVNIDGEWYNDDYESSYGQVTLTLDTPLYVASGQSMIQIDAYWAEYWGSFKAGTRKCWIAAYDTSDQLISQTDISLPESSESGIELRQQTINAPKNASVSKVVFYLGGKGKFNTAGDDDDSYLAFCIRPGKLSICGQKVNAIRGYNGTD